LFVPLYSREPMATVWPLADNDTDQPCVTFMIETKEEEKMNDDVRNYRILAGSVAVDVIAERHPCTTIHRTTM
jgi:hypothetical protein